MARQQKLDFAESGEYCPSTSVCPKQCPAGKKLCTYEDAPADADGCGHEELCVDIARDSQNKLCAMDWCPPICSGAETLQDNGIDEAAEESAWKVYRGRLAGGASLLPFEQGGDGSRRRSD